ncbi:MAG: hypothetical protein V5A76_06995 [Candidatus Thermoplasmatota archaeon]
MINPTTILGIAVFLPAVIVLYYFLGEYERYFKANKALFLILAGLAVGMGTGYFSLSFFLQGIVLALLLIILVEIIKLLVMMQKPFRMNYDTPFYGFGFGAGIGAMMVFTLVYGFRLFSSEPIEMFSIFLISYNYTLVHASTGGLIGYGSSKGDFWIFLLRAVLISGLHVSLMTFFWEGRLSLIGDFAVLVIGAVYGTFLVLYLYNEIFPKVISDKMEEIEAQESKST